jgi:hypothetical protein
LEIFARERFDLANRATGVAGGACHKLVEERWVCSFPAGK